MKSFSYYNKPASGSIWKRYKKKVITLAIRMEGPFEVKTKEGMITCEDGYLARDEEGWPYPISKTVFDMTYEKA